MIDQIIMIIVTALLAGITWTMFGYFVNWRKNQNNPEWEGFNVTKLRNDLILGTVLGVATAIAIVGEFFTIPPIDSVQSFIGAFPALFTAIVAIDKFIIGGVIGRTS